MPKYAVTKAMKVLHETTNNNSESQLVWWCCGHDCVARSQGNPSVLLLSGYTMRPENGNIVQLKAVLALWWMLPMNLQGTISSVQIPVLSHKNVVASKASNSRLVINQSDRINMNILHKKAINMTLLPRDDLAKYINIVFSANILPCGTPRQVLSLTFPK